MATRTKVSKTAKKTTKATPKKVSAGAEKRRGLSAQETIELMALDKEYAVPPDFSVATIIGEVRALRLVANKQKKRLLGNSDVTSADLAALGVRQAVLERADRGWAASRRRTASPRLVKAREAAEALEKPMIDALKHFLKADKDVQLKVRDIEVGTSDEDTIDDLKKLADLIDAHAKRLTKADMPAKVAAKARAAAEELAVASDNVETDDAPSKARGLRDRAFWHLRELMDFVRDQGRYVFRNEPDTAVHFRSSSARASETSRAKAKKKKDEPTEVPA